MDIHHYTLTCERQSIVVLFKKRQTEYIQLGDAILASPKIESEEKNHWHDVIRCINYTFYYGRVMFPERIGNTVSFSIFIKGTKLNVSCGYVLATLH